VVVGLRDFELVVVAENADDKEAALKHVAKQASGIDKDALMIAK
jgi:hypothetical protein